MKRIFLTSLLGVALLCSTISMLYGQGEKPNILFIAVDDMNCDFGAYGNPEVRSPNLDDLASEGVLFTNNHCQQPVCGASRASVLSGFTPEHTGITSFYIYLRDLYPDVVTIPQFFKNEGYTTVGMGKIHDPRNVSETDNVDMISWSNFINITGSRWLVSSGAPVTEMADLPDASYVDGQIAANAVQQIQNLAGGENPFFLAVGFKKPHLPFVAPKKYWDFYDRDSISLAPFRKWAENDVEFVHNPGGEFFNSYDNVPEMGTWSSDLQREYIHGYYACVSFIDTQVGKLIEELKNQGIYDNTIIVLWGDHGFSLGDHTNWGKHTNFEYATRSPMIIRAPGLSEGVLCKSPTELLDIYPTLVDLAGYTVPDTLDGNSLVPILSGEKEELKSFAVSQYRRGGNQGFVLRTEYYQYVEWTNSSTIQHQQLFNFAADPYQTVNLFSDPDYQEIIDTFSFNLNRYLDQGINTKPIYLTKDTDSLGLHSKFHHVSFSIYGDDGQLEDAIIQIDKFELPSSKKGYAGLNLQPGSYSYTIQKEDYWPASGTFDLGKDTLIVDTLQRNFYYLSIEVVDSLSQSPITGLSLEFNGETYTTDLHGIVDLILEPGEYNLLLESEDYSHYQGLIQLASDTTLLIKLRSQFAFIKFKLNEDGVPVVNALVNMNSEEIYTNAIGIAYFGDQKVDLTYNYTISKNGYQEISDSFVLLRDTTLLLSMEEAYFTLEITVLDSLSLQGVADAVVELNEEVKFSNSEGKVSFDQLRNMNYDLFVSKDGYNDLDSTLEIRNDTVLTVKIGMITSLDQDFPDQTRIYPNPAVGSVYISSFEDINHVTIHDMNGTIVSETPGIMNSGIMNIDDLKTGMYIIRIQTSTGSDTHYKLFVNR